MLHKNMNYVLFFRFIILRNINLAVVLYTFLFGTVYELCIVYSVWCRRSILRQAARRTENNGIYQETIECNAIFIQLKACKLIELASECSLGSFVFLIVMLIHIFYTFLWHPQQTEIKGNCNRMHFYRFYSYYMIIKFVIKNE